MCLEDGTQTYGEGLEVQKVKAWIEIGNWGGGYPNAYQIFSSFCRKNNSGENFEQ